MRVDEAITTPIATAAPDGPLAAVARSVLAWAEEG